MSSLRKSPTKKKAFSGSDDESSDSEQPQIKNKDNTQKNLAHFMQEPYPLQPKIINHDFDIYTAFPTQFEDLPNFNKDERYLFQEPQEFDDSNLTEEQKQKRQELFKPRDDKNMTLQFYCQSNRDKLVYLRYSDYNIDKPTEINDKVFLATYMVKLKKFFNEYTEVQGNVALSYQDGKDKEKNNENGLTSYEQYANNVKQQEQQQKSNEASRNSLTIRQQFELKEDSLWFDSRFESGNLFSAYKVSDTEYDLILQNDINTKGNTQWFFFSVRNAKKGQKIRFNILNLMKPGSLFNEGLCPCTYSQVGNDLLKEEWVRNGYDIKYYRSNIYRDGKKGMFYNQLTFHYEFQYDKDTVYFAHSYPYTASEMYSFLNKLTKNEEINQFLNRKTLCKTIAGNNCEMIVITDSSQKKRKYRKGVVFTARQHPGETGGSYMMHGIIEFLTGNSPEAVFLRESCIFKIIPMINIDGVIHGNYRTSLAGCDLNRQWKKPKKKLQPVIHSIKEMIKKFTSERDVKLILDLHGHSRKMNAFFYGCNYKDDPLATRIFPYMLSKLNPAITFKDCRFSYSQQKEGTARVALWKDSKIPNVFTLEASFQGVKSEQTQKKRHFTIQDYKDIGRDICLSLYNLLKEENLKTNEPNPVVDDIMKELTNNKELLKCQEQSDSGSDSNPSEDELGAEEVASFLPKSAMSKKQKKRIKQIEEEKKKPKPVVKKEPPKDETPKKIIIKTKKPEKKPVEKPVMVDQYVQTDSSFLQEYRAYLLNKQKQQQQQQQLGQLQNGGQSRKNSLLSSSMGNNILMNNQANKKLANPYKLQNLSQQQQNQQQLSQLQNQMGQNKQPNNSVYSSQQFNRQKVGNGNGNGNPLVMDIKNSKPNTHLNPINQQQPQNQQGYQGQGRGQYYQQQQEQIYNMTQQQQQNSANKQKSQDFRIRQKGGNSYQENSAKMVSDSPYSFSQNQSQMKTLQDQQNYLQQKPATPLYNSSGKKMQIMRQYEKQQSDQNSFNQSKTSVPSIQQMQQKQQQNIFSSQQQNSNKHQQFMQYQYNKNSQDQKMVKNGRYNSQQYQQQQQVQLQNQQQGLSSGKRGNTAQKNRGYSSSNNNTQNLSKVAN